MRTLSAIVVGLVLVGLIGGAVGGEEGAVGAYMKAKAGIVVDSPSSTNLEFRGYPPFGAEWDAVAKEAWDKNGECRRWAREARLGGGDAGGVKWAESVAIEQLNSMRHVANDLADAAMYLHVQGRDGEALAVIEDLVYQGRALRLGSGGDPAIRGLVGVGIEALTTRMMLAIAPAMKVSADGAGGSVKVEAVRGLISQLVEHEDGDAFLKRLYGPTYREDFVSQKVGRDWGSSLSGEEKFARVLEIFRRQRAESGFTAMSLAAQLFEREKGRWATDIKELVPGYLPRELMDPWGDGKEALGYVVVKGGRPGGGDRVLVFARSEVRDGLMYRVDEPQYSYYDWDGSTRPRSEGLRGGQFRDLTRWEGRPGSGPEPAMKKLELK